MIGQQLTVRTLLLLAVGAWPALPAWETVATVLLCAAVSGGWMIAAPGATTGSTPPKRPRSPRMSASLTPISFESSSRRRRKPSTPPAGGGPREGDRNSTTGPAATAGPAPAGRSRAVLRDHRAPCPGQGTAAPACRPSPQQDGRVTGLTGREDEGEPAAVDVDGEAALRGQSTAFGVASDQESRLTAPVASAADQRPREFARSSSTQASNTESPSRGGSRER